MSNPYGKKTKQWMRGLTNGYRSQSEVVIAEQLKKKKVEFSYESLKLKWEPPVRQRTYTPDFVIPRRDPLNPLVIECKGLWTAADRQKHQCIIEQFPHLDIRLVFDNPNQRLYKGSKTSYAEYCDKKGYKYSPLPREIPKEWLANLKE